MRILAIRLDRIGDFAVSLPGLKAAHEAGAIIDVLITPTNSGWIEIVPWVNRWWIVPLKPQSARRTIYETIQSAWNLAKLAALLPLQRYDVAIDLRTYEGEILGKLICWLARSPIRIGSAGKISRYLITETHRPKAIHMEDQVTERLALAMPLKYPLPSDLISITRKPRQSQPPVILIHPGTMATSKEWVQASWITFIQELAKRLTPDAQIRLVGGPKERPQVEEIAAAQTSPLITTYYPQDIADLTQIISEADLQISLDSAPAHLARLVGTPTITLFAGSTALETWAAKGDNTIIHKQVVCTPCYSTTCSQPTHLCMEAITPQMVLETTLNCLKKNHQDTH